MLYVFWKLKIFGLRFFTFFWMPLQKNVKSRVFLDFQKNVKNVFSNYADKYASPESTFA